MGILYLSIECGLKTWECVELFRPFHVIDEIRGAINNHVDSNAQGTECFEEMIQGMLYRFKIHSFKTAYSSDALHFSLASDDKDGDEVGDFFMGHMMQEFTEMPFLSSEDANAWCPIMSKLRHTMRKWNEGGLHIQGCMKLDEPISRKRPIYLLIARGGDCILEFVDFYGEENELNFLMTTARRKVAENLGDVFCSGFSKGLRFCTVLPCFYGLFNVIGHSFVLATKGFLDPYSCLSVLDSVQAILEKDLLMDHDVTCYMRMMLLDNIMKACNDLIFVDEKRSYLISDHGVVYVLCKKQYKFPIEYCNFTGNLIALKVLREAALFRLKNTAEDLSFAIVINGQKWFCNIQQEAQIATLVVSGIKITEDDRKKFLEKLCTMRTHFAVDSFAVRDLTIRTNEGESGSLIGYGESLEIQEYCAAGYGDFIQHLNYCFIAHGSTLLIESVDFEGPFETLWSDRNMGTDLLKSSPQEASQKTKQDANYNSFQSENGLGCFVSSSIHGKSRSRSFQDIVDGDAYSKMDDFLKEIAAVVRTELDLPSERCTSDQQRRERNFRKSLGPRVKKIMAISGKKCRDGWRRLLQLYDYDDEDYSGNMSPLESEGNGDDSVNDYSSSPRSISDNSD